MLGSEKYSTLTTAYSLYFDEISPASVVAKPLLGASVPDMQSQPPPSSQQSAAAAPAAAATAAVDKSSSNKSNTITITLTPIELAIVCIVVGILIGILFAQHSILKHQKG